MFEFFGEFVQVLIQVRERGRVIFFDDPHQFFKITVEFLAFLEGCELILMGLQLSDDAVFLLVPAPEFRIGDLFL